MKIDTHLTPKNKLTEKQLEKSTKNVITLAICGLTHKESYKDIFVTSVLIPLIVTAIIVIGVSIYF